jgi:hypothetical protein
MNRLKGISMADRSVTIQYRYSGYKEEGSSLLATLKSALRQVDNGTTREQSWKSRLFNRDGGRCIFANNIRRSPEGQIQYLFGDLIMFEENASFSIFRDTVGPSVAIEIENLEAGENFLKGKGFWFIVDDHVFTKTSHFQRKLIQRFGKGIPKVCHHSRLQLEGGILLLLL